MPRRDLIKKYRGSYFFMNANPMASKYRPPSLRRDRLRLLIEIIERIGVARLALHLLDRVVAARDQQAYLGTAHLKQRIGGDRCAV